MYYMGFYSVFYYFYIVTETSSTAETHALGLLRDLVYSINGKWPLKKEMIHVKIDLQK